jgi:hypothetical protein
LPSTALLCARSASTAGSVARVIVRSESSLVLHGSAGAKSIATASSAELTFLSFPS